MVIIRRIVAGVAGVVLGIIGAVGLAETGIAGWDNHVEAAGFHQTGVLAWIQVFAGLLLLASAASWAGGGSTGFLGALVAAFGFVVLISGAALHDGLGVHDDNGILFVAVGGITALFGFLAMGQPRPVVREHPA